MQMDNVHFFIAIGLPTFAIIASLIVSMFSIAGAREDARETRAIVAAMAVQLSALASQVSALAARLDALDGDVKLLTGKVWEMMGGSSKQPST